MNIRPGTERVEDTIKKTTTIEIAKEIIETEDTRKGEIRTTTTGRINPTTTGVEKNRLIHIIRTAIIRKIVQITEGEEISPLKTIMRILPIKRKSEKRIPIITEMITNRTTTKMIGTMISEITKNTAIKKNHINHLIFIPL